jgi:hypothetical protein
VAIPVRGTVLPPYRSSLAERDLCGIDAGAGGAKPTTPALCIPYRSASIHQFPDELMTLRFRDRWICRPPKPAADDEVAPVRRRGPALAHATLATGTSSIGIVQGGEHMSNVVIQAFRRRGIPTASGMTTPHTCVALHALSALMRFAVHRDAWRRTARCVASSTTGLSPLLAERK